MSTTARRTLTVEQARKLPKIVKHEHYDCSIQPRHVLSVGTKHDLDIPAEFKAAWKQAGNDACAQEAAAVAYQHWLQGYAKESLTNYLTILWNQVLPTLQTGDDLYATCKQRINDAVDDGMIALALRFAPQLHRRKGLTLQQVVDPLQQAVSEAPFPVRLVVCSLRHENGRLGRHLADLVIRNKWVTTYDLAGDESKFPGVLKWWARQAKRVSAAGKTLACHIGETNAITDEDHRRLDEIGCTELGHAIKGDPRDKLCTACITSNLVTGVVATNNSSDPFSLEAVKNHPIDKMYRDGRKVNIDLDGTLLTGTTSSNEYVLLNAAFGWDNEHFLRCNLAGLAHFPVDDATKRKLEKQLRAAYA